MNCREAQALLGAYVDGELDLVRSLDAEAHVRECPACSAALERLHALHTAVSCHAPYYDAPPELHRKLAARLESKEQWPRVWWPALAAACLLAALVLWTRAPSGLRPASSAIERDVVAAHVRSLLATHLMDVPSSDRHTVKPWFAGKLDFAPEVQDLSAQGFTLAGGRLDYIDGRTVAALVYQRRLHTINVFTWPANRADTSPSVESLQGFHVVHWVRHGMEWWAVSDLAGDELAELARLL
ncbi:MAG: anti-sigma factor [Acidobacteriia bacterium]|nr:anti-sigma factor [Terriglobia bacterium]